MADSQYQNLLTVSTRKAYYSKKRADGKSHREALVAVARKLVHVIYAVLSKQEPYDPNAAKSPELASRSE